MCGGGGTQFHPSACPFTPARRTLFRMGETFLDLKGLSCPLPVLRANRVLRTMRAGEKLRVLATDRASVADFRAYCRETGHDLISCAEEAGVFSFTIRRRADRAGEAGQESAA